MQWDSVTEAALDNIDLAVQGIAAADATLKALDDARKAIDEQKRLLRAIRQEHVANRNRCMDVALRGDLSPEEVAARGDVRVTTMYKGIADTTGQQWRGRVNRSAAG